MRRESAATLIPYMLAFTAIQLYFTRYVEALSLHAVAFTTPYFKWSIPLTWPVSGAALLQAAASWSHSIRGLSAGKGKALERLGCKAAASSSLLLFLYAVSIFGLFILSSPLLVRTLSSIASAEPSFKTLAENVVQSLQPLIEWPMAMKYAVAQFTASTALLIGSLATGLRKGG